MRRIEPRQLLTENDQVDVARGERYIAELDARGWRRIVLRKGKIDIGTSRLRQGL